MATLPSGSAARAADAAPRTAYRRSWRVLHACDCPRRVLPLIEGQLSAGMRPALVSLNGFGPVVAARELPERPQPGSLLGAWGDVRSWRRSLLDSGVGADIELVHAHDFAPGMAGVRAGAPVVYDVHGFVEENAIAAGQCEERSWLARSFRVAEQFVLSRAAAIVVHDSREREGALERGAAAEALFRIPEAIELEPEIAAADPEWLAARGLAGDQLRIFAADGDSTSLSVLLGAFEIVRRELPVRLLLPIDSMPAQPGEVQVLFSPAERRQALFAADLVITSGNAGMLEAMQHARPLLAADVRQTREITPDGRGCLWYRDGDARDLAVRILGILREASLRSALAEAGYRFLQDTRAPAVVAKAYDQVYRYAYARRRSLSTPPSIGSLQPLNAAL